MNHFQSNGRFLSVAFAVSVGVCGFALPALAGDGDCVVFDPAGSHVVSPPFVLSEIAMDGTRAYASNWIGSFQIFDVSDPAQPTLLGSGFAGGSHFPIIWDLVARDEIVFAGVTSGDSNTSGLYIVDTTNPVASVQIGSINSIEMGDLALAGDYVYGLSGNYASNGQQEFYVVDVSDLSAPTLLSRTALPSGANGISKLDVVGDTVYLAMHSAGLAIFDVSDPTAPVLLGSFDSAGDAQDVVVDGSIAYLGDGADGLKVIDVHNPTKPCLLMSYPTFVNLDRFVLNGSILYGNEEGLGVRALDVSDPFMIDSLGVYLPGTDRGVLAMTVKDDHLMTISTSTVPGQGGDQLDVLGMTNTCDTLCNNPADMNNDGALDFFDVTLWVHAFVNQDPAADFTGDGQLNNFDLSMFLQAFLGGCP